MHPGVELVAAQAEVGRTERDVLAHRGHEQLVVGVLEDHADPAADLLEVLLDHRHPGDLDGAGPRGEDAVEVQHQRRLAGAVGAEQRDPLALVDVQVDAEQGLVAVGVGVGQAAHVEDRGGHQCSLPCPWGSSAGIVPSYPRASMARCTRSPRS